MNTHISKQRILGFTLLELLVVMAIIGILAAIGIASFGGVQAKARDARRKSDIESFARALEMFYNDKGRYPIINSPGDIGTACTATGLAATCDGFIWGREWTVEGITYMTKIPTDPKITNYRYNPLRVDGVTATQGLTTNSPNGYWLLAHLENEEDASAARTGTSPGFYNASNYPGVTTLVDGGACKGQGCNYIFRSPNSPMPLIEAYP